MVNPPEILGAIGHPYYNEFSVLTNFVLKGFHCTSAEVRGENTQERKFVSTGSQTHNHHQNSQPPIRESDTLTALVNVSVPQNVSVPKNRICPSQMFATLYLDGNQTKTVACFFHVSLSLYYTIVSSNIFEKEALLKTL